jgi:diaminopropionate ammonia-lyase
MTPMIRTLPDRARLLRNPHTVQGDYPDELRAILSLAEHRRARACIASLPDYQPTTLHCLNQAAREFELAAVWLKDESTRFGLGAFKSMGGAYAVYRVLEQHIRQLRPDAEISPRALIAGEHRDLTSQITFACASAGNHGRAVAWGAHLFGARCIVYLYQGVGEGRRAAIEALGAKVDCSSPSYDHGVRRVAIDAERAGWHVVSDTAYPGYMEIPRTVMQGYTVIAQEALEQLGDQRPTHVFLQAGVGGFAAAIAAHLWETLEARPRIVLVEPAGAACVLESLAAGRPVTLPESRTIMGGLNCAEPSLLAWEVLRPAADWAVAIPDNATIEAMRSLAQHGITAGESGAAGFAALSLLCANPDQRKEIGIDQRARVLLFSTEGATDRSTYEALTGLDLPE